MDQVIPAKSTDYLLRVARSSAPTQLIQSNAPVTITFHRNHPIINGPCDVYVIRTNFPHSPIPIPDGKPACFSILNFDTVPKSIPHSTANYHKGFTFGAKGIVNLVLQFHSHCSERSLIDITQGVNLDAGKNWEIVVVGLEDRYAPRRFPIIVIDCLHAVNLPLTPSAPQPDSLAETALAKRIRFLIDTEVVNWDTPLLELLISQIQNLDSFRRQQQLLADHNPLNFVVEEFDLDQYLSEHLQSENSYSYQLPFESEPEDQLANEAVAQLAEDLSADGERALEAAETLAAIASSEPEVPMDLSMHENNQPKVGSTIEVLDENNKVLGVYRYQANEVVKNQ